MARRRAKPRAKSGPNLEQLLTGEIIGGILVVLAILLMLSLLSSSRGQLTDALVGSGRQLFGVGVWLAPLLMALLGLWLALRHVTDQTTLTGQRLIGAVMLFLVIVAIAHIIAPGPDPTALAAQGGGGGMVGLALGQGLEGALGAPVALVVLLMGAIAALVLIVGRTPNEIAHQLADGWESLQGGFRGPDGARINPPLPLGEPSALQRWWRSLTGWRPPSSGPTSTFKPPPSSLSAQPRPQTPAPRPTTTPRIGGLGAPAAPAPVAPVDVQPRIVGGRGQTWRTPVMSEVLEEISEQDIQGEDLRRRAHIIETTLEGFGIPAQVVEANQGPAVTQFGLRPGIIVRKDRKGEEKRVKVRVSQIQALSNDLSLALAASPIRIEAPVPGRDIVGVEVPNVQISLVALRGVMESEEYRTAAGKGPLVIGLGRDVSGTSVVADLTRMPHLLIAGATGAGKSVCVNAIITALLLTHTPDTLRFLMIDPKRVELTGYNGIPHLLAPVVVDVERTVPVLLWATREMERRYRLFAKMGARNIESYNEKLAAKGEPTLPYIVILIDELADLMLSAPDEVERHICRIAQMARATGMHLVIATQRPSVDVVTGLIKANFPARIAFAVTSQIDSRVILDTPGAEQLLGRGDMLFMAPDASKLQRLQGCFVAEGEAQRLVRYWRGARAFVEEGTDVLTPDAMGSVVRAGDGDGTATLEPPWLPGQETLQQPLWTEMADVEATDSGKDEMYDQAVIEVRKAGRASVSLLQRRLRIGYSRASRLIEQLEADGVVGPDLGGSRGREVIAETDQG